MLKARWRIRSERCLTKLLFKQVLYGKFQSYTSLAAIIYTSIYLSHSSNICPFLMAFWNKLAPQSMRMVLIDSLLSRQNNVLYVHIFPMKWKTFIFSSMYICQNHEYFAFIQDFVARNVLFLWHNLQKREEKW